MAARMSEIGMSAVRASEIKMRHSAAHLQMMAGTVANKAHGIATILSRSTTRVRRQRQVKTIPTAEAEDENSPMSQQEELQMPEPEAEVPESESTVSLEKQQEKKGQQREEKEKELLPLLPWEVRTEDGTTRENLIVKQKILELAIYRRTFVEPADGEEEYKFDYAVLSVVAKELLLSNPNLREKRETLVKSVPVAVVSEETFWRNFFLRCNAVRLSEDMPAYLPEVWQTLKFTNPLARLRRGLFRAPRSSANLGKSCRGFFTLGLSTSSDSDKTSPSDDDPSDLELDVDSEIEKELVKRHPSRAVEVCVQPVLSPQDSNNSSAVKPESTFTSKETEDTSDGNSPSQSEKPEKQA